MKRQKILARSGFALPAALLVVICSSVVVGGVVSYVSYTTRYVKIELARTRCLAAAQSAIEQAKGGLRQKFHDYLGSGQQNVHLTTQLNTASEFAKWFVVSRAGGGLSIGTGQHVLNLKPAQTNGNSRVYLDAFRNTQAATGTAESGEVTIVATAVEDGPNGLGAAITVAEKFSFASSMPSEVFNNAYFVNNYGWMSGSGIIINGDIRANGDLSINGSTINGRLISAPNDEVGAVGRVTLKSSPQIQSRSDYQSQTYNGKANKLSRPLSPPSVGGPSWNGGFTAPDRTITLSSEHITNPNKAGHAYITESKTGIPMPYISDLSDYKRFSQEVRDTESAVSSTLKFNKFDPETCWIKDGVRQTIEVSNYSTDDNLDTPWANEMVESAEPGPSGLTGVGPSGDIQPDDRGALVLIGTKTNPIEIDGPVVIASDVVIMGYVKGQGTIYSGRNIHIVGDITYVNPPSWTHPDSNPESTRDANRSSDLISLMAKGCVVVGDYTDASWQSKMSSYMTPSGGDAVTKMYYCDDNDSSIGYPRSNTKFNGDYMAVIADTVPESQVNRYYDTAWTVPVVMTKIEQTGKNNDIWTVTQNYKATSFGSPVKMPLSNPYRANRYDDDREVVANSSTNVVVTTKKGVKTRTSTYTAYPVIGNKKDPNYNSIKGNTQFTTSSYPRNKNMRYYNSVVDDSIIHKLFETGNGKIYSGGGKGVARIDSVIFDNHATFGLVGQYGKDFAINGALVCRDEGLCANTGNKLIFNWDIRLKGDGAESIANEILGLPSAPVPQTLMWQIVPSSWNSNYK